VINLDFEPEAFRGALTDRIRSADGQLPWLAESIVADLLTASMAPLLTSGYLLAARAVLYGHYKPTCLADAAVNGIVLWYLKLLIDAPKGRVLEEAEFRLPSHLVLNPISYGTFATATKFKHRSMRARERHEIEFLNPSIPSRLFRSVARRHVCGTTCDRALLDPVIDGVWDWQLQFACRLCGRAYYCACFELALQRAPVTHKVRAREKSRSVAFLPSLCHLCTGKPSNLEFCHPMYGSSVLVRYGPYIRKLEHELGLSARDAENRVREALGIARIGEGWISETQLYHLVVHLFTGHSVTREASPEWLGRQRLDIYVSELGLAIEYQGQQHFSAVDLFGGDEALARTRDRDRRKRDLCEKNGVTLVYFRHDEPLTEKAVMRKLKRFLKEPKE
jgi:hypothetical protein